MSKVIVNDISIYYEIQGRGKPLVLVMGLGLEIAEAGWLIRSLAQDYKVLAFDNRGAGRTDKPDIPYSVEMMADDTSKLMDKLGIKRADVLGISMGGRIALDLTLKHSDKVARLVLVSSSARVMRTWRRYIIFNVLHRLPFMRGKQPRYAFARQSEASSSYDGTSMLPQIQAPTLIMNGRDDKLVQPQLVEELHSGIKGSKLQMFDGGHLFFIFKGRQQFLDVVVKFLEA